MTESDSKSPIIRLKEVDFAWHAQANLTIKSGNFSIEEHEHVFIRGLLDLESPPFLILSVVLSGPSEGRLKL